MTKRPNNKVIGMFKLENGVISVKAKKKFAVISTVIGLLLVIMQSSGIFDMNMWQNKTTQSEQAKRFVEVHEPAREMLDRWAPLERNRQ